MSPRSQHLHEFGILSEAELSCARARRCHYKGRLASNNAVFDSSYERGRPLSFKIGVRQVIAGDARTEVACGPYPASWHMSSDFRSGRASNYWIGVKCSA